MPDPKPTPPLRAAALAVAGVLLLAFLTTAPRRALYPYDLEWLEGPAVISAERLARGEALYTRPGLEHIALPYPPLYFAVAALASRLLGPGYAAPRLVSLGASLASFALLARWLRRRGHAGAGTVLASAGLLAGTWALSDRWFELAKVDSLHVALVAAAFLAGGAERRRPAPRALAAGLLLALAFLTKQTGALFVPFAALAILLEAGPVPAGLLAAGFALPAGLVLLVLHLTSGGWSSHFILAIPAHFTVSWPRLALLGASEVLAQLPVAAAAAGGWLLYRARLGGLRPGDRLAACGTAGAILSSALQRGNQGGWWNVHMATHWFLALLLGLALADAGDMAARLRGRVRFDVATILWGLTLLQLGLLLRDPRPALPGREARAAKEAFLADLRGRRGPVLVPDHPYDAVQAGGFPSYHRNSLEDHVWRAGLPVPESIVAAVAERRFRAVVTSRGLDPPGLAAAYRVERRLSPAEQRPLWMASGVRAPPEAILVPRP